MKIKVARRETWYSIVEVDVEDSQPNDMIANAIRKVYYRSEGVVISPARYGFVNIIAPFSDDVVNLTYEANPTLNSDE